MQLQLRTILNHVHPIKGFVYADVRLATSANGRTKRIDAHIVARKKSKGRCAHCGEAHATYDHQPERSFAFVPLWGLLVYLFYAPRRIHCPTCGIHVEAIPWAAGKSLMSTVYMSFLATWARRMSWTETARAFGTTWDNVYRAVTWVVEYGLAHRDLDGITALGIDEIHFRKGNNFLTLVYQINGSCRRLLWVAESRTHATINSFFEWFGEARSRALEVVCSDMWKPYLKAIRQHAGHALNVLDKFHIIAHLNAAVDQTRRREAAELRRQGDNVLLKNTRWCLLKRPQRLTVPQRGRLRDLLRMNLRTARAYLLKEDFEHFWGYISVTWAGKFLDRWSAMVRRSGIEPMKAKAKMLTAHRDLVLNYFVTVLRTPW